MDMQSHLITVEKSAKLSQLAQRFLGYDCRITFEIIEAERFLPIQQAYSFDLIFADSSTGKFHLLFETIRLLKPGGFHLIDHLLPQSSSNEDQEHARKVKQVITTLEQLSDLVCTTMNWSTGLLLAVKR